MVYLSSKRLDVERFYDDRSYFEPFPISERFYDNRPYFER
jgi:hypothetical protein